jgi:hypothetical protein
MRRQQTRIGDQVRALVALGKRYSAEQMRGRLEFLRPGVP